MRSPAGSQNSRDFSCQAEIVRYCVFKPDNVRIITLHGSVRVDDNRIYGTCNIRVFVNFVNKQCHRKLQRYCNVKTFVVIIFQIFNSFNKRFRRSFQRFITCINAHTFESCVMNYGRKRMPQRITDYTEFIFTAVRNLRLVILRQSRLNRCLISLRYGINRLNRLLILRRLN